jgi:hypothetical protein
MVNPGAGPKPKDHIEARKPPDPKADPKADPKGAKKSQARTDSESEN